MKDSGRGALQRVVRRVFAAVLRVAGVNGVAILIAFLLVFLSLMFDA